jgi:hypothetical protein
MAKKPKKPKQPNPPPRDKPPKKHGSSWTPEEVEIIRQMVKANISGPEIGAKLGRTEDAIYAKAAQENILLRPRRRRHFIRPWQNA